MRAEQMLQRHENLDEDLAVYRRFKLIFRLRLSAFALATLEHRRGQLPLTEQTSNGCSVANSETQSRSDHWGHRAGWIVLDRATAGEGLCGRRTLGWPTNSEDAKPFAVHGRVSDRFIGACLA